MICPPTPLAGALTLAESVRAAIDTHPFGEGRHISASMGVSSYVAGDTGKDRRPRRRGTVRGQGAGRNQVQAQTVAPAN